MKLSRKIRRIYLVALLGGIVVCLAFYIVMIYGATRGEYMRVQAISVGVNHNFEREKMNLKTSLQTYTEYMNVMALANGEEEELLIAEKLNLEKRLKSDNIEYKIILNNKFEIQEIYTGSEYIKSQSEVNVIVSSVYESLSGSGQMSGILGIKEAPYIFAVSTLDENEYNTYLLLVDKIDEEMISEMGKSTGSQVQLLNKSIVNLDKVKSEYSKGLKMYTVEEGSKICSYTELENIAGNTVYYLKVIQEKEVQEKITSIAILAVTVISSVALAINIILYMIIKEKVITRIVNINKSVNKIVGTEDLYKDLEKDSQEDEISNLTVDINNMFHRLRKANSYLKYSEKKHRSIINSMSNGYIYIKTIKNKNNEQIVDGYIMDINNSAIELFDIEEKDVINSKLSVVWKEFESCNLKILSYINDLKLGQTSSIGEEIEISKDKWGIVSVYSIEEGYIFIIVNEITKLKKYSGEMEYLANYDRLTNLYNRNKMLEYLENMRSTKSPFTMYFVDLDNFKNINDTLGHNFGDEILKLISKELLNIVDNEVIVGRLGGDEFIVVDNGDHTKEEIQKVGEKIIDVLKKSYKYGNYTFNIKASIGASCYPKDSENINAILKYADIAMYCAKNSGGNKFEVFTEDMLEDFLLEEKIREGIENGEFTVYYQPIYNINKNTIEEGEALIRWKRNNEMITPDKFISRAKMSGDIVKLDYYVLESACELCREYYKEYGKYISISVNISYKFLKMDNFIELVMSTINKYKIKSSCIKVEITEDEIIEDTQYITELLVQLRNLGIKISLDDFGTGYSSFNYIKTLPLDILKIDRSLLLSIETDKKTLSIIETLIKLSKDLNLQVVCEGVELESQLNLLKGVDCDKIQGYYISKPVPKELFKNLIIE